MSGRLEEEKWGMAWDAALRGIDPAPLDTGASPGPPGGLAGDSAWDAAFIPTAPSASPPTPI